MKSSNQLFRRIALAAAVLTFGLIVLGGVVRITGSGMGCGEHWPRCNGEWFPRLDLPTMIEIGHRWAAALVSLFVLSLAVVAWVRHQRESRLRNPATLALGLLIIQVLLGPVIVKLSLPPEVIIVHLANAMILFAVLIVACMRSSGRQGGQADSPATLSREGLAALPTGRPAIVGAAIFGFTVILLGALVANYHAGLLCAGFPLCNGQILPPPTKLATVHWIHRVAAFGFLGYMTWLVFRLRQTAAETPSIYRAAQIAWLLVIAQIAVAAAMVLRLLPPELRAMHLMFGTGIWASLVLLVWHSRNPVAVSSPLVDRSTLTAGRPSLWQDLVTLTKPRIISLLLVTTVAPMFITPAGMPRLSLVLWVILGGYLMAGGANAINMWFDGDIDTKMSRTKLRPIPSGRMTPLSVLAFGCTLGAAAFAIFYRFANPLSAWLALSGLLFYVFIYTIWLKRSSPQNIVIGGAAGAFPPLVGWTAMTGRLDLMALYLFAIIFYWTPPHFWALALIKQNEYARAGVPMMPVVRGERSTKIQMLGYTIMLIPLTLLPWISGSLGTFYGVAAILLGGRLLWYCFRLLKEQTVTPTAWGMYKYSLLYLFLLFAAMGFDRAIPTPSPFHKAEVLVLKPQPATPQEHPHSAPR